MHGRPSEKRRYAYGSCQSFSIHRVGRAVSCISANVTTCEAGMFCPDASRIKPEWLRSAMLNVDEFPFARRFKSYLRLKSKTFASAPWAASDKSHFFSRYLLTEAYSPTTNRCDPSARRGIELIHDAANSFSNKLT